MSCKRREGDDERRQVGDEQVAADAPTPMLGGAQSATSTRGRPLRSQSIRALLASHVRVEYGRRRLRSLRLDSPH